MKPHVLVSVYNISGYLVAELEALLKYADIAVIESPCDIPKGRLESAVKWIDRREQRNVGDVSRSLNDFEPDVYLCGGWADRLFVDYARCAHRAGVKTVLLVDTPWKGTFRQWIHCLMSRVTLTPTFDFAWGAGEPQRLHLRRLGFRASCIRTGYYCADTAKFEPIGEARTSRFASEKEWPHIMLYIGRYTSAKNMRRMERAFVKVSEGTDWKLRCIGSGELWDERTIHPRIEHLGYKSPAEIQDFVKNAGCFVLPSVYEPWGVVVHEAALMGLPLLCSSQIQAATAYLKEGENGYTFDPLNEDSMAKAFVKTMSLSDEDLATMGHHSHLLGKMYVLSDWVQTVLDFLR